MYYNNIILVVCQCLIFFGLNREAAQIHSYCSCW